MRIGAFKRIISETARRTAQDAPEPAKQVAPETPPREAVAVAAAAAVDALKARADATFPGQFAEPATLAAREDHKRDDLPTAGGRGRVAVERTVGSDDLVDLNYLLRGLDAARSVARIAIRSSAGDNLGDATGFLVSPSLLLTNWHVFQGAEPAACWAEFDYELDREGGPRPTTRFALKPGQFYLEDQALDYALVAVAEASLSGVGRRADYRWLRLNPSTDKILDGEPVTIIQHPDGRPKQIALRENRLLGRTGEFLTYEADTAPGSSGAPVFNNSWQVVALHHSGVPATDAAGNWLLVGGAPATDESSDDQIDWIANEGVRISTLVADVLARAAPGPLRNEFEACCLGRLSSVADAPANPPARPSEIGRIDAVSPPFAVASGAPVTISISVGGGPATVLGGLPGVGAAGSAVGAAVERNVEPWHDKDYSGRKGYQADFLGGKVALPELTPAGEAAAARLLDNSGVLVRYTNFSLVMHADRRLPIFTAANVDFSTKAKEPEPGYLYTRKPLGGLGENDREKWFLDPRLPASCQLPDRFFNNDRKAFDKGHLVRREEVCWGATYEEVRRANGDSYHVTNCTPQVNDFNQSMLQGIWGRLENLIETQGRFEKYSLFAGPLMTDDDPVFMGVDDLGPIQARIPRAFWKVIVARKGTKLQSFGFLLKQDLSRVRFEFRPSQEWVGQMASLTDIQTQVGLIRFDPALIKADQFGKVPTTPPASPGT